MSSRILARRLAAVALLLGAPTLGLAFDNIDRLQPAAHLSLALLAVVAGAVLAVGGVAILLLYAVLRPLAVRAGSELLRQRPAYTLFIGLLLGALFLGGLALAKHLPGPVAKLTVLIWLLVGLYLAVSGAAMLAHALGEQVLASLNSRHAGALVAAVLVGAVLVALLSGVPLLGQLLQGLLLAAGVGAAVVRLGRRRAA